jgi:protocatechuate 3,4-dioxygenase alpha subunit
MNTRRTDMSEITTSQTIGPFPHEAWRWAVEANTGAGVPAPAIVIEGRLLDGNGEPVDDGWVEAWMPQSEAAESALPLPGFRRVPTGSLGEFRVEVSVAPAAGEPAAWITVFGRGILKHQFSAVFTDDGKLADSEVLAQVPESRRATLIARRDAGGVQRWDIHLQGPQETVFFDFE